jgi:peptidoglycan hydrolase CwlO-like protein
MDRRINIFVFALLLMFVVTAAYAPDTGEKGAKEPSETRLRAIEQKLDELIKEKDSISDKLDEIQKQLDTIESLVRTRA